MGDKLKELAGSRKFWAGMIAAVAVYCNSQLHIVSDTQMATIAGLIGTWIVGQGLSESGGPTAPSPK